VLATLLSVTSSLLVGVILVIAPWTSWWDQNYLLQPYPVLRALMLSPFARGLVSGLGLVNIALAILEVHQSFTTRRERAGG
jgi:hypothetical protein